MNYEEIKEKIKQSFYIYICGSEADALAYVEAGTPYAVAITTEEEAKAFLTAAKEYPKTIYIFIRGKNDGEALEQLQRNSWQFGAGTIKSIDGTQLYSYFESASDAILKDKEAFLKRVNQINNGITEIVKAEAASFTAEAITPEVKSAIDPDRSEELKRTNSGAEMIKEFVYTIKGHKYESINTGLSFYDRITDGGFMRGELITLGAAPGAGKTMFAQLLFEGLVFGKEKFDVLYINLEMTKEQLIARSISRIIYQYQRKDYTAKQILRGYNWTKEQEADIMQAINLYSEKIAPHFIYNPNGVTNELDNIIGYMKSEAERLKSDGKPAPIVCVDYLQLITTKEREASEGIKKTIKALKDFAKDYNTCVFAITAHNRRSNESGAATVSSGRDTSAIEYSGDTMLTLSYAAIEENKLISYEDKALLKYNEDYIGSYNIDVINQLRSIALESEAPKIPKACNELMLKVVKSRFDGEGRRVRLYFDGKHAMFTEIDNKYKQH